MTTLEHTAVQTELDPVQARSPRAGVVIAALMLAVGLAALDATIVGSALPRIASDLHGLNQLSWVVTAFLLAQSAGIPLYGKLSDTYGRKPLLLTALAIFLAGSGLCGFAASMGQLTAFRAIQGLGAGGILPLASAMMADVLSPRERGRYQGLFTAIFTASNLAGPVAGGLLTSAFGWRWVFLINLPFGALALPMMIAILPKASRRIEHAIDYPGAALLIAFTVTLLSMASGGGVAYPWLSLQTAGLGLAVAALLGLLLWRESVAAEPIMPLNLFQEPTVTLCLAVSGLIGLPYFGGIVFLPLYFQMVLGMTPAMSGLMMMAQMVGSLASSVICGAAVARSGRYKAFIVWGVILVAAGMTLIGAAAWFRAQPWLYILGLSTIGIGGGASMPNLTVAVQNAANRAQTGVATSMLSFVNTLCASCGVAISGAIMARGLEAYIRARLPGADAHHLVQIGVQQLGGQPKLVRTAIMDAYGHAIALTFLVGSLMMTATVIAALLMPNRALDPAVPRSANVAG